MDKADVVLVCPPVAPEKFPSFGLSLLKAALNKAEVSCFIDYASFYYVNAIGEDIFLVDWMEMDSFFIEYIFATVADIKVPYSFDEVFELHMEHANPEYLQSLGFKELNEECLTLHKAAALRCMQKAKEETEKTVQRILAKEPKVVGCSATTVQLNASLAILKRVKELRPDIITIMGGYHCFGESGVAIIKEFPYLDYVFSGESDDLIAPFCTSILAGEEPKLEYGILKQGGPYPEKAPHRVLMDMNLAPIPDYGDFYEIINGPEGQKFLQLHGKGKALKDFFLMEFEASRGCWWGAKFSCTFCGLNGVLKNHRRKDPQVFLKQLEEFVRRYDLDYIMLTDTLLPLDYIKEVVPRLAERPLVKLASEIKAVMTEDEISLMSKAGYCNLMIGVESLSDHMLQLMRKGTLAINNLATIKYCYKHHILPGWNLLTNFPGETVEDYEEQLRILPLIEHFPPASVVGPIFYIRNNDYVTHPEKHGLALRPSKGMHCISPANEAYIKATATVYELAEPLKESPKLRAVRNRFKAVVQKWSDNDLRPYSNVRLDMRKLKDHLKIMDSRACRTSSQHKLYGVERDVYLYCDTPKLLSLIVKAPELQDYSEAEISGALHRLEESKLVVRIKDHYLALAIEMNIQDYILRYVMQKV